MPRVTRGIRTRKGEQVESQQQGRGVEGEPPRLAGEGPESANSAPVADDGDDARERRIRALHDLAVAAGSPPVTEAPANKAARSPLAWRRLALLAALSVVVVAGVTAGLARFTQSRTAQQPQATPAPTQVALALGDLPLACPEQALFSPDGSYLAVVVHAPARCDQSDLPPRLVALFDARTARFVRTIAPDTILAGLGAPKNLWTSVVWSPDGTRLAFTLNLDSGDGPATWKTGLLIVPAGEGAPRLYQGTSPISRADVASVWDVPAGKEAGVIPANPTPAGAYRWTPDGRLQPDPGASAAAGWRNAALGGDPTLWQAGLLMPVLPRLPDGADSRNSLPPAFTFQGTRPVWSADGRFLSFPLAFNALLTASPSSGARADLPDAATCATAAYAGSILCTTPLSGPDAGFARVAGIVATGQTQTFSTGETMRFWGPAYAAWRPDGKVLAALLPGDGLFDGSDPTMRVTLYDARSGAVLKTLSVLRRSSNGGVDPTSNPPLAWSADGKQLALTDFASTQLTIWQGAALPA